jgi:hypothetical protein
MRASKRLSRSADQSGKGASGVDRHPARIFGDVTVRVHEQTATAVTSGGLWEGDYDSQRGSGADLRWRIRAVPLREMK